MCVFSYFYNNPILIQFSTISEQSNKEKGIAIKMLTKCTLT